MSSQITTRHFERVKWPCQHTGTHWSHEAGMAWTNTRHCALHAEPRFDSLCCAGLGVNAGILSASRPGEPPRANSAITPSSKCMRDGTFDGREEGSGLKGIGGTPAGLSFARPITPAGSGLGQGPSAPPSTLQHVPSASSISSLIAPKHHVSDCTLSRIKNAATVDCVLRSTSAAMAYHHQRPSSLPFQTTYTSFSALTGFICSPDVVICLSSMLPLPRSLKPSSTTRSNPPGITLMGFGFNVDPTAPANHS